MTIAPGATVMHPTLLFDFGGTLDADGVPAARQFHRAFAAERVVVPFEVFSDRFRASDRALAAWPGIGGADMTLTVTTQARWLASDLRVERARADRAAERVLDAARRQAARNRRLLDGLRSTHRLAVVSNFTGNLDRCLAELGLAHLFHVVADSGRLGVAKPAAEIFQWALRHLDADAGSAWMIGDNFDADVRPAAALGMTACWIAPADRAWPAPGTAGARIASLSALPELVRGRCTV